MRAVRVWRGSTAAMSIPDEDPDGAARGGRPDTAGQAEGLLPRLQGLVFGHRRSDTGHSTRSRSRGVDRTGGAGRGCAGLDTDDRAIGVDGRDGHGYGLGITPVVCYYLASDDGRDDAALGSAATLRIRTSL